MNITSKRVIAGLGTGALMFASLVGIASAQTTTTTPGVPTTGAGGEAAMNFSLLSVSALAMAGGLSLLRRSKRA